MEGGILKSFSMYYHPTNKILEGTVKKENCHSFVLREKRVIECRLQNCERTGSWTGSAPMNKKLFLVLSYVLCSSNFLAVLKRY